MKKIKLPSNRIIIGSTETRFGWLSFTVTPKGLKECRFMFGTKKLAEEAIVSSLDIKEPLTDDPLSVPWSELFRSYFEGKIKSFDKVPVDSDGWSDFQKKVYNTVKSIPYGKTASYGAVASFLGNEKASRAVGNALKNNPVAPVIPCHRVISSDKDLCGFSASGGIELKLKMLELEKDNS
ncbi:MAG TPA: methylated-DNA--[protein]-cysteine S-methyltransferase [Clostridiales bacterium]|nr:methylated-DNA--[protein]-cysteine S-methyltransferase [Clostridiales bacterium]HQP69649.1 methylated-DNA--[protein]-cysteine S-methyltransferase [Clostridiales bacterium]